MSDNQLSRYGAISKVLPLMNPGAKVFFVGPSAAAWYGDFINVFGPDSEGGNRVFNDLDTAISDSNVVASRGDVILVLPGYSETITGTDIVVDKAGLSIIGIGQGSLMPTISHNNAVAEVSIAADNVLWKGFRHRADVTSVAIGIEIEDGVDYTAIKDCLFDVVATGTDEFTASIHMVNDNTGTVIEGNTFHMGLAAAVAAIHMDADTADTVIRKNYADGDYSTAVIVGDTTLSTGLLIEDNLLINGLASNIGTEPGIELLTGTTGIIRRNDIVCNLATKAASIVADTCFLFENHYNEDITGTGGLIGTASADD